MEHPSAGEWTEDRWRAEWTAVIDNPTTQKVFTRGQWCVGEFVGVQILSGQSRSFSTSMLQSGVAEDADHLNALSAHAGDAATRWNRQAASSVPPVQPQRLEIYQPREGEVTQAVHNTRILQTMQHNMAVQ